MADKFGVASLLKTACCEWTCAHNASSKPRRHSDVVTTWRSSISGWYQVVLCAFICVVVAAVLCVRDPRLNARRGVVAPARRVFRSNLSESVVDDYNITACDRTKLRRRSVGVRIVCVCVWTDGSVELRRHAWTLLEWQTLRVTRRLCRYLDRCRTFAPRNTCRPQSAVVGICSWLGLGFRIRVSVIRVTIRNITFSVLRTEFMLGLRLWLGFRTRSYG